MTPTDRANYIVSRRLDRINRMVTEGKLSEEQAASLLSDIDFVRLAGAVLGDIQSGHPLPSRT